jgi:hypothetical protein
MCRAGGRRCLGCHGTKARNAHNDRRRRNRELKRQIIDAAIQRGVGPEIVAELRDKPPGFAQQWADDNQVVIDRPDPSALKGLADADRPGNAAANFADRVAGDVDEHVAPPAGGGDVPPAAGPVVGRGQGRRRVVSPQHSPKQEKAAAPLQRPSGKNDEGSEFVRRPIADVPMPREMGDETRVAVGNVMAAQGAHPEETALLNRLPVVSSPVMAGVNGTNRITFHDGSEGFHKPFSDLDNSCASAYGQQEALQPVHEAAAWQMAKRMGPEYESLVPPCVLRHVDGKLGSVAKGVKGGAASLDILDAKTVNDAAFFDSLLGNQDRHRGNYLIDGDKLHLIDHGFAFAKSGDTSNQSRIVQRRKARGGERLTKKEIGLARELATSPDLWGMQKMISPDRALALRDRARTMAKTGRLLGNGQF